MLPGNKLQRVTLYAATAVLAGSATLFTISCNESTRATSPGAQKVDVDPVSTTGMGSSPTNIGQGTYSRLEGKRVDKDWEVQLKAEKGLELVARSFSYGVGSCTGWHQHPGPVLISIIEGTVTFYNADDPCTPITVHAGEGYLDNGEGHMGRNLSGAPAKD